jgi:hypothetical protein
MYLRLIFMGKLLGDEGALNSEGVQSGSFLHAAFTQRTAAAAPSPSAPALQEEDDTPAVLRVRGFGRLSALGLQTDAVRTLRAMYAREVQDVSEALPPVEGETAHERMVSAESPSPA